VSERERERRAGLAEALRRQFDAAFAAPPRAGRDARVALLEIRVGGEPMALRVLELAGLVQARPVTAVPSRRRELLGVAGLRGAIVPVWSLARLLGRGEDPAPAWIALAGGGAVGLAVAALDAHLLVAPASLAPVAAGQGAPRHVRELLRREGRPMPVLDVPSLVRAITEE
jgi:chemotaxis signal transduction protein